MTVLAVVLSECVSAGFQAVPFYDTNVVTLDNGHEKRNANRVRAQRRFACTWQNFRPEDFAELLALFHVCMGRAYAFLFKDWTDFEAVNEPLGLAPAASTPVQLTKTYAVGVGTDRVRNITKPSAEGFVLYQNGTPKAGTLDTTTGLFTPTTAWSTGQPLTWSGEHFVPVRFMSDEFPATFERSKLFITANAELMEVFD